MASMPNTNDIKESFFIKRPVLSTVISLIITLLGAISLNVLPVEQYPNMIPVQVQVSATYPGASAEIIANTVASPLEQQINGVDDMIYMQSVSAGSGTMVLNVYFKVGTDPDQATINVNNRVQIALNTLPQDVQRLGVTVLKQSPSMLQLLSITSPGGRYDTLYLSNYAMINVVDELKRLPGVGDVNVFGAKDYSMRIWLKPDKMAMLAVTPSDIATAVDDQNAQFATGRVGDFPLSDPVSMTIQLNTKGRLVTVEEFENIIIRSTDDGSVLRLKDVARVELGAKDYSFSGKENGNPSQPIGIYLAPGANALETSDRVKETMQSLSRSFPEGVSYTIPFDTTTFVRVSINEVVHTLFEAMVLVFIVVFLFLQNWRATLIPCLAVPVSIVGTFAGMYALDFSINTLTLFGLVLAIGIVVDDAIIVLENVERIMHEKHVDVRIATAISMNEVTGPIIAVVLVLCSVFLPVAFLGGLAGQMYKQFAITIAVSVTISGIVALSFTPSLCVLLLKLSPPKTSGFFYKFNCYFEKITGKYVGIAKKIQRKILMSAVLFTVILFGTYTLFVATPTGLVPDEDQGYLIGMYVLPEGASLSRTSDFSDKMDTMLLKNPAVANILTLAGVDVLSGVAKTNMGTTFVMLKDWDEREKPELAVNNVAMQVMGTGSTLTDGLALAFTPPSITGMSNTGGFEFYIQDRGGNSVSRLYEVTQDFINKCSKRPEIGTVSTTFNINAPQVILELDRERARALGVSVSDVFNTMAATFGVAYLNDFNLYGRTYKVRMQADGEYRSHLEDISEIYVRNKNGKMVPMTSLITKTMSIGPQNLERFNAFTAAKIQGSQAQGYSSGQALNALEELSKDLPEGFSLAWSGQSYQELQTSGSTVLVFVLALIMVFMVLSAQYESFILPLSVLVAIPFAVFGALVANYLRGYSNDVYFQVAIVTLVGLGAKNAILIVEFAADKLKEGLSFAEASLESLKLRFRPVVMTSLAFILGCLPLAMSSGAGAGSRHAIGTAVVGGMLAATVLAPLFVPFFFTKIMEMADKIKKKLSA